MSNFKSNSLFGDPKLQENTALNFKIVFSVKNYRHISVSALADIQNAELKLGSELASKLFHFAEKKMQATHHRHCPPKSQTIQFVTLSSSPRLTPTY